jgi:hypothetical protein
LPASGFFGGAAGLFFGLTLGHFLLLAHLFFGGAAGLLFGFALCHFLLLAHLLLGSAAGLLFGLALGHFLLLAHLLLGSAAGLFFGFALRHFLLLAQGVFLLPLHRDSFGVLTCAFGLSGGPLFGHGALLGGQFFLLPLLHGLCICLQLGAFGLGSGYGSIRFRSF